MRERKVKQAKKKPPSEVCDLCAGVYDRLRAVEVWVPGSRKPGERQVCFRCKRRYAHWLYRGRSPRKEQT